MTGEWKLVERECTDGICLTIWHTGRDSKLGSLSLDHKNIGEAIVDELNRLEDKVLNIDAYVESVEEANEWLKTVHKDLKRENNQLKTQLDNCLNKKLFSRRELEKENEQLKLLIKKVLETTPIAHSLAMELKNSVRELYD